MIDLFISKGFTSLGSFNSYLLTVCGENEHNTVLRFRFSTSKGASAKIPVIMTHYVANRKYCNISASSHGYPQRIKK